MKALLGFVSITAVMLFLSVSSNAQAPAPKSAKVQLNQSLISAILKNDAPGVEQLLWSGADPNATVSELDTYHKSPDRKMTKSIASYHAGRVRPALLIALEGLPGDFDHRENVRLVQALLDAGANIDARDERGETALICASGHNLKNVARLLMERGANVNLRSTVIPIKAYDVEKKRYISDSLGGESALWTAAQFEHTDIMLMLLENGADPNFRWVDGETVLMSSIFGGRLYAARLLLEHGADPNMLHTSGESALMFALDSDYDHPDAVELLLKHGARTDIKRADGMTAAKLAEKHHLARSLKLLIAAGVH